jgi:hypothetical protein
MPTHDVLMRLVRVMPMTRGVTLMSRGVPVMRRQRRSACAVPHHLPVTQAAAPAERALRHMRGRVVPVPRAAMHVAGAMIRLAGPVAMRGPMLAHVDPTMARARSRERRERRRHRLLRARRRRCRRHGDRLIRRGRRLIGNGLLLNQCGLVERRLLRRYGRGENCEGQSCKDETRALH